MVLSINIMTFIIFCLYLIMFGVFITECKYGKYKERIFDFVMVSIVIGGSIINDLFFDNLVVDVIVFVLAVGMLILSCTKFYKILKDSWNTLKNK